MSPAPASPADPSRPRRVLLVDDDGSVRELMRMLLCSLGADPVAAPDGPGAIAALAAESRFDLVLLDQELPGLKGLAVARRMREIDPDLPIVLMSGDPAPEAEQAWAEGLIQGVLTKPILLPTLRQLVADPISSGPPLR